MLSEGVIEPACCECGSPIVFAPKEDGTLWLCIDYRKLKAITVKDVYPIRLMDECIVTLSEAKIFSIFYCTSGYWQIPIDEKGSAKTAFVSNHGLYRLYEYHLGSQRPGHVVTCNWYCTNLGSMEICDRRLGRHNCILVNDCRAHGSSKGCSDATERRRPYLYTPQMRLPPNSGWIPGPHREPRMFSCSFEDV